jgi:hypothetical protein
MKKFDTKAAENMSHEEIQALICDGLAEVCDMLSLETRDSYRASKLDEHAETFRALGKLFTKVANNQKRGPPPRKVVKYGDGDRATIG